MNICKMFPESIPSKTLEEILNGMLSCTLYIFRGIRRVIASHQTTYAECTGVGGGGWAAFTPTLHIKGSLTLSTNSAWVFCKYKITNLLEIHELFSNLPSIPHNIIKCPRQTQNFSWWISKQIEFCWCWETQLINRAVLGK